MALWIDPPAWAAHGRLWSHLISDTSLGELHAFAAAHGVLRQGFERDHYDVPAEAYDALVAAGAIPVSPREVVRRLAGSGLRKRKVQALARRAAGRELVRPRRLHAGDLVAIVATAGVVPADRLQLGIERLESWGLRVRVADHVLDRDAALGHLAGTDADRAADFTDAFLDDEVSAVMLARGGFGTQRLLDQLDWRRLVEATPKAVVGFSDVTALHQALASKLGLATVHGHVVTSLAQATPKSAQQLRSLLLQPESVMDVLAGSELEALVVGVAEGVLVGGNLAMLTTEIGTSTCRPGAGGIVVLEEVSESPYRIDRQLTQLLRSGWFDKVRGVVIGAFTNCGDPAAVAAIISDRLVPLGVPLVSGAPIGHRDDTLSVPLGVRATLDAERGSLTLAEPALR